MAKQMLENSTETVEVDESVLANYGGWVPMGPGERQETRYGAMGCGGCGGGGGSCTGSCGAESCDARASRCDSRCCGGASMEKTHYRQDPAK